MTRESARSVAIEAIVRVTERGGYSNLAIPGALRRSRLSDRDRALATELAYGTIRRLIPLDDAIGRFASRPVSRMSMSARAALRLGAYQLLHTSIAPHAAVSETVDLATSRERGFVNAILRRLADSPPEAPAGQSDDAISLRTGLSRWAVAELRRLLGDEADAAAASLGARAPLTIRVNTECISVEDQLLAFRNAGIDARAGAIHPGSIALDRSGDPASLPGFAEGCFAIQDEASSFVVDALDPRAGDRVLDVCAGPGGKAVHAASLVGPDGVVVAADVRPRRAALVARAAARLGVHPLVLVQDARTSALRGSFDRVLVDAPCSGIGSARRRPELLWRADRSELSGLARLQVAIASAAADMVRPGGRLVYSVCTFPRAETDAAADAIVRHRPDLEPEETPGPDGLIERHRLWPHRHGCDAMFVAAFRRSEQAHR